MFGDAVGYQDSVVVARASTAALSPFEIYAGMALATEGVEKDFTGRTRNGHRRRPAVGLEHLITPSQYHTHGRASERAPPEPTHDAPNVGVRLRIELSRLPAVAAPTDVFVVHEELVGVAHPIGARSTQR